MAETLSTLFMSLMALLASLTGQLSNLQLNPLPQVAQVASSQKTVLTPADFTYLGYYDIQTNGSNSTYSSGLTHRYVNGQFRLMTLVLGGLHEFALPSSYGSKITSTTGSWNISGMGDNFTGIWWDQAKQKFWTTSSIDYGSSGTYYPTKIATADLLSNGTIGNLKVISLQGISSKRVYGGALALPSWFQSKYNCGPYAVGFGGYTSLMNQTSKASLGPELICIPDPANYANGAEVPSGSFRVLLDTVGNRGYRLWTPGTWPQGSPINYFDGGDTRQNPSSRPTVPPASGAAHLAPNSQGYADMVWGDSYYNTGMWIETSTKHGYVAIAALCKGFCWYQSSTLAFDGRTQELHIWDPNTLGNGLLTRPTSMTELNVPRGSQRVWSGNTPTGNISGATYDPVTGRMYMVGYPFGPDDFTGRIYVYQVGGGGTGLIPSSPTTSTTPTDAVVSSWSAWSDTSGWSTCVNGTQTKTQIRTRTVITAATNGGTTPALSETQTVSQSCTSTPTQPVQTNPVGHWKLDESSGSIASDSSGNANSGTLNNGPVWSAGRTGNALSFDGSNDYVLIGNPATLIPGNTITMMGWARFDRVDVSQAIISKYGNNSNITQLRLQGNGEVRCSVGGTTLTTSGAGLRSGVWHHLACAYDGSNIVVYVDGVVKGTMSKSGSIADSSGVNWRIGSLDIDVMYMDGLIDDVRIYNRALSSSEVASVMNSSSPTTSPSPTDAVVSSWSAWSDTSGWSTCVNGTQTKTQIRTRTVITAATNGGTTPALSETQTVSQSCTATTPTDAVLSDWSAWTATSEWSTCLNGTQTRTERRTRTVISPATNGGTTGSLTETRTVSQSCTVSTPVSSKFSVGESVQTTASVNVRESGDINGGIIGTQTTGVSGSVEGGPVYSGGFHWWKVNYTNYPDGWSVEDYLAKYVAPTQWPSEPTPAPEPVPEPTPEEDDETEVKVLLTKNLYYGMRDPQVKILQTYLIRTGHLSSGNDSGFFGRLTYNAVRSFQRSRGIQATGYVGPITRAVINAEL